MELQVPYPQSVVFHAPRSWEEAVARIAELRPVVTALARKAFALGDASAWYDAQCLLYHWNLEELTRTSPVTDLSRAVRQALRNAVLEIEQQHAVPRATLKCWDHFTQEAALRELQDAALAHRLNRHPLLVRLSEEGLSRESLRLFLENYFVNNRVFHLHIAAQSLSAPLSMRVDMYKNLFDELGQGKLEGAHPVLFLNNFRSLGAPPKAITPLGGALYLLNTKIFQSFLSGDFRQGVGSLGFLELAMPPQMQKLYDGVRKSGVSEEDALFWKLHITLDQEHGEGWMEHMAPYVETREHAQSMLRGGLAVLDARARFYDDVWNAIPEGQSAGAREAA